MDGRPWLKIFAFGFSHLAFRHQFCCWSSFPNPVGGGLFIESRKITPRLFLFFSGAGRRWIGCAGASARPGFGTAPPVQARAAEKQKEVVWGVRSYKQATPTGFKTLAALRGA